MAADWEEVKRLAADFQKAQLSSTVQKLSERNCIEIVKKLIELQLIDVIFTSDGKEYLTPQRLLKEIKDELYIHGGRINMVELAQILQVDFSHIENKANEYARSQAEVRIVLGQLISNDYLDHLAEEVNEKLHQNGHITIAELTKIYDLPGDFLEEVVYSRFGTIINAQPDPNDGRTLFTPAYIAQHKAVVQGVLSAVTRPVLISHITSHFQIPDRLFFTACDELMKSGRIQGSLTAGRSDKTMYIPDIYSRSQNSWVDSFYQQNGYLEYDSVARLGIADPKSYIKKRFKDDNMTYLNSCCVGKSIMTQVESAVEEALTSGGLVDVMPILPSVFTGDDCQQIAKTAVKSISKQAGTVRVYGNGIVVSDAVIQTCLNSFEALMTEKAKEDIQKKPHLFLAQSASKALSLKKEESSRGKQDKKEEKKKKGGKTGGGTQGRETKTRSVKKKYHTGKGVEMDSDDETGGGAYKENRQEDFEFLDNDAIAQHLQKNILVLQEFDDDFILEISEELLRPLNKKYEEYAKSLYVSMFASSASARRKQYADFQEKLNNLLPYISLYDKSVKLFSDEVSSQLSKYLLKTLCTDVVNMVVALAAQEHGVSASADINTDLTPEARLKLIEKLPDDLKSVLKKAHNSLNSKTAEDFLNDFDPVLDTDICKLSRKMDKKKERIMLSNHRQSLLSQLSETEDPALCLHLSVLLIFQTQTRHILHASGKFVPHIIGYLQKHVPFYIDLAIYQENVIKLLATTQTDEDLKAAKSQLMDMMPKIKEHAVTYKKATISESEH